MNTYISTGTHMATEKQWRRNWKETLKSKPWSHFKVEVGGTEADFLIKHLFTDDTYEIMMCDLAQVYYESLDSDIIQKRNKARINNYDYMCML